MSIRLILAATAALAVAAPAFAQTPPAPAAAPAAEAPADPAEAALEAKGQAFGASMQAMAGEMQSAITAAGGDQTRAHAALDAIVSRYQPQADSLAADVQAFIDAKMAASTDEQEKASLASAGPAAVARIKGVPVMVRDQMIQASAAPAAAPATPPAAQ